jgi:hypothetical protein
MNKPVRNYNKLASLFGNNRVTGEKAEAPADVRERFARMNQSIEKESCMNEERAADTIEEIDLLVSQNRTTLQGCNFNVESSMCNQSTREWSTSKKKLKTSELNDDDIVMLKESFKSIADAIKESTVELVKSHQRLQIPESEIWTHLEEL